MNDGVSRIPRREKDRQVWAAPACFIDELAPIHPTWQSDVCKQKMDVLFRVKPLQCYNGIRGR